MEFHFNVNEYLKRPIVEIGNTLLPPDFTGDRRALWVTVNKVAEVVNEMGEASAHAQGLNKPITTAERLRQSDQNLYLLVDQAANGGNGAVTGMLKIGKKGLYVFDREGQHYQVTPPCVLDFYVHEKRQRSGLGKKLFEYMLEKEKVKPYNLAVDRPSDKFLNFLRKHYDLQSPIKQMNNYVVFDGFFPDSRKEEESQSSPKNRTNGLQSTNTPSYGRYGAPRPPCSMGQIIHNTSSQKNSEPTSSDNPTINKESNQQDQNQQEHVGIQKQHQDQNFPSNNSRNLPQNFSPNNNYQQLQQNSHPPNDYYHQQGQNYPLQKNYQQQEQNFSPQHNCQQQYMPNNFQNEIVSDMTQHYHPNNMQYQNAYTSPQNINQYYANQNNMRTYQTNQIPQQPLQEQVRMFPEREPQINTPCQCHTIVEQQNLNQQFGGRPNDQIWSSQSHPQQVYQVVQNQQNMQNTPQNQQRHAPVTNIVQPEFASIAHAPAAAEVAPQYRTPTPDQRFHQPQPQMQDQRLYYQPQYPQEFVVQQQFTPQSPPQVCVPHPNYQQLPPMTQQGYYQQQQTYQQQQSYQQPPTQQIDTPIGREDSQYVQSVQQEPLLPKTPVEHQQAAPETKEEKYGKKALQSDTVQSLLQVDPKYFKSDPIQIKQPLQLPEKIPEFPGKINKTEDTVATLMGAEQEYFENGLLRDKYRIPIQREEKSAHNLSPDHLKFCPHHHEQQERHSMTENQMNQLQPIQQEYINRQPLNTQKQSYYIPQEQQFAPQQTYKIPQPHSHQQYQMNQQDYQVPQTPQGQYTPSQMISTEAYRTPQRSAGNQQMDTTRSVQDTSRLQQQCPQVGETQEKRQDIHQYHVETPGTQSVNTPMTETQVMEDNLHSSRSKTGQSRFPTTIRQSSNNPADLNTFAEGPERTSPTPAIDVPHSGAEETKSSDKKKIIGQYGLNDADVRRKVYKSAIVKKTSDAQEVGALEYGYPPQFNKNVTVTKVVAESVNNSPKLERPKSLEIQTENSVQEVVKEVLEVVETNDEPEETIKPQIEKLQIKEVLTALPIDHETDDGKKTPRHLTEQGYFDLKFYHNKLW